MNITNYTLREDGIVRANGASVRVNNNVGPVVRGRVGVHSAGDESHRGAARHIYI